MSELLTRLSKLHSVFSDHLFADITLSDIGDALRSVLDANICLCTPEGELLYTHECARFSCGHAQQRMSCRINSSRGELDPVAPGLLSDVSVICRLAERVLEGRGLNIYWRGFERHYDTIRDSIARVVPGFEDFNRRMEEETTFVLPHGPRDSRTFPTATGKAQLTVHHAEYMRVPEGRLILQTMRAHDQHNTTIYSLNDRYRGISNGRFVVFVNPDDLAELGLRDGQIVDIFSEWPGRPDRVLRGYRVVSYPSARGCAALYFPEGNELIHREAVADVCNTPTSKQIIVRIEPGTTPVATGRPVAK